MLQSLQNFQTIQTMGVPPSRPQQPTPFVAERLLRAHHVAKICGVTPRAIRAAAAAGRLLGFKLSDTPKIWRFRRGDVERYRNQMSGNDGPGGRVRHRNFYSCFISYSMKDQDFAERLHGDLEKEGVQSWFATHDVKAGKKLHEQIDEAIQGKDRLLLILSEHSMRSEWVKTEIAHARQKELKERRQVLFPIALVSFAEIRQWQCFDADAGKDSAREIREYYIPDFSNWRDAEAYQKAFARLLRDLQVGESHRESRVGR